MIKIEIDGSRISNLTVAGTMVEIQSEISILIQSVFHQLKQNAPKAAAAFRYSMTELVASPESPIWEPLSGVVSEGVTMIIPLGPENGRKKKEGDAT